MAKVVVTQTHTATVVETTRVVFDVPEGMIPQEFVESMEEGDDHEDAIWEAIESAFIQYDNDDPDDGPVACQLPVFVGSDQCRRDFEWHCTDTAYTIEGES